LYRLFVTLSESGHGSVVGALGCQFAVGMLERMLGRLLQTTERSSTGTLGLCCNNKYAVAVVLVVVVVVLVVANTFAVAVTSASLSSRDTHMRCMAKRIHSNYVQTRSTSAYTAAQLVEMRY
jgi:hypothetical protein